MDWTECKKNSLVKDIKTDKNLIISLINSSAKKFNSQKLLELNEETASSKVSLSYESLRELLEALAINNSYKIYNHECYCAFLKEVLLKTTLGDKFDKLRKIRNNINYYGKDITKEESKEIINEISEMIQEIKKLL